MSTGVFRRRTDTRPRRHHVPTSLIHSPFSAFVPKRGRIERRFEETCAEDGIFFRFRRRRIIPIGMFPELLKFNILDHLQLPETTTCELWKITRQDGLVLGFTTFNKNIIFDGVTYYSARGGFNSTSISTVSDFSASNMEVDGYVDSEAITRSDLLAKKYDGAKLKVSLVNYEDLTQGELVRIVGSLGEVTCEDGSFKVEILGISKALQADRGPTIEKYCIVPFCSRECSLSAFDWTVTGTVTSTVSTDTPRRTFTDTSRIEADNWFKYGELTWLTGNNTGYRVEVFAFAGGEIELFEIMPHVIRAGDTYSMIAGCDKEFPTCQHKWGSSNHLNFRGYGNLLPGRSALLDYPSSNT